MEDHGHSGKVDRWARRQSSGKEMSGRPGRNVRLLLPSSSREVSDRRGYGREVVLVGQCRGSFFSRWQSPQKAFVDQSAILLFPLSFFFFFGTATARCCSRPWPDAGQPAVLFFFSLSSPSFFPLPLVPEMGHRGQFLEPTGGQAERLRTSCPTPRDQSASFFFFFSLFFFLFPLVRPMMA